MFSEKVADIRNRILLPEYMPSKSVVTFISKRHISKSTGIKSNFSRLIFIF